jgi:hypothetical protein
MKSITSNQLQCVMPSLSSSTASSYATSMNKEVSVCFDVDTVFLNGPHPWVFSVLTGQMSGLLTTSCDWAAILGNIGCESAGLTTWTQVKLQRGPTHAQRNHWWSLYSVIRFLVIPLLTRRTVVEGRCKLPASTITTTVLAKPRTAAGKGHDFLDEDDKHRV